LLDKSSGSGRIPRQNSLFYGVLAGSKCICPEYSGSMADLETEKAAAPEYSGLPSEMTSDKLIFIDKLFRTIGNDGCQFYHRKSW